MINRIVAAIITCGIMHSIKISEITEVEIAKRYLYTYRFVLSLLKEIKIT